eukprot:4307595-Amphidinium_carterae.1
MLAQTWVRVLWVPTSSATSLRFIGFVENRPNLAPTVKSPRRMNSCHLMQSRVDAPQDLHHEHSENGVA